MISFFRKLRQKLLEENRVTRYLIYALGEILLVVIGILIALWVNNQNELAQKAEREQVILTSLKEEFQENLNELDRDLQNLNATSSALETLLDWTNEPPEDLTEEQFENLLSKSFSSPDWTPSTFILEELKNSGGLSQLSDPELRAILFEWQRIYEDLSEVERDYNRYSNQYIDFLSMNGSVRNLDAINEAANSDVDLGLSPSTIASNSPSLLKSPEFENRVDNFYFLAARLQVQYERIRVQIQAIIDYS